MTTAADISAQLARQDTQSATLHELLQLAAAGNDVSAAAERVVRHCLYSSTATTPQILSLSLDVLNASPAHAFWVDTLSVLIDSLRRPSSSACLVALSKIPPLPHAALQHIALFATTPLIAALTTDRSPAHRAAAVTAVAAFVLRDRPLTALSVEPVRLEQLTQPQIGVVRTALERLTHALVGAVFDPVDSVAIAALRVLTQFGAAADAISSSSVLRATKEAAALAVWDLLRPTAPRIANRLSSVTSRQSVPTSTSSLQSEASSATAPPGGSRISTPSVRNRRDALKSLARLAAHILSGTFARRLSAAQAGVNAVLDPTELTVRADPDSEPVRWASGWTSRALLPACDDPNLNVAWSACSAVLTVCSHAAMPDAPEKVAAWGIKAVTRISRMLHEHDGKMSALVVNGLVKDAARGLAALSKNDSVTSKFVVSTAVGLLPYAARCPRVSDRLESMSLIASTVVEYDLSGRDAGVGVSLASVTASEPWKSILSTSTQDSTIASEMVCCFAQSLLEASRKIDNCPDFALRASLTDTWAVMLSQLMQRTALCLNWPYSSASSYAKEMFLKLFEALGQYSAFMLRTKGTGMEEYERLQELLVKAALSQNEVNTRAAILICVTKYWLTSGMKAESNAGHVLKAIWRHIQEHFRDEEVMLKELRVGALWSDAQQGSKTPEERAVEGGYISMATAFTKRTRAAWDTVNVSVTNAVETSLFGSVALATAAAEGSTLTTDFAYTSLSALLALVQHNPRVAEKGIGLLRKYILILEKAESSDLIVLEAVRNTLSSLEMYQDEFFPKPVPPREISSSASATSGIDPYAWLGQITESCVFATSRLDEPSKEAVTLSTEESVLHVASLVKKRLQGFNITTLRSLEPGEKEACEGNQQTLNGASDPFSVVASHAMDTVKGLALLRVHIINRSKFNVPNASLTYSAAGALTPLPDSATTYLLGAMEPDMAVMQRITLAVRYNQGFAGKIYFAIHVRDDDMASDIGIGEQTCIPYYIPSSDVLLLRNPAPSAGVDVFRRRWDLMREAVSFHVIINRDQSVDGFVDTLERKSQCLRQVGRMRTYSHVSALVADSSRGDYVAVAALAPEAQGLSGVGPCMVYVTIRSNSAAYNRAFRDECRDWLEPGFKVIILDEDASQEERIQALRPQDAFFISDGGNRSPYQRWREAHAARMTY